MINLLLPSKNYLGQNCIEHLNEELAGNRFRRCLIITDSFLVKTPTYKRVLKVLSNNTIGYKTYDQTMPNPTIECVDKAYSLISANDCDFLISIGGGSAHDLAKAVGIKATAKGDLRDYAGVNKISNEILPLICINTTSGTGSEVTRFTIITDTEEHKKMAIIDNKLIPWISINDTHSLITMPKGLTGATGMDAITHAIEAYLSTDSNTLTDTYALKAIDLISNNLLIAYRDGSNTAAREKMAKAQFMAGVAFSNASLGYVHAIAHQLGGLYNLPHGVCNAVLLPIVLEQLGNRLKGEEFGDIAKAMGISVFQRKNKYTCPRVIRRILDMNKELNIPVSLTELGVKKEDISKICTMALNDACRLTSPIQFTHEELVDMLGKGLKEKRI